MNPIYTFNDTSIEIKIIDEEGNHYKKDIPNNDINKDLIENTVFKFEKSGAQTIIMHDDIHVFQLSKMECNYSDYIKIKKQLEHSEQEIDKLKNDFYDKSIEVDNLKKDINVSLNLLQQQLKLDIDKSIEHKKEINELFNTNNLLQQQINSTSYYLPVVFLANSVNSTYTYHGDDQWVYKIEGRMSPHQWTYLYEGTKLRISIDGPTYHYNHRILIPPKKTVILFKGDTIEIYSSGSHNNIEGCNSFWCGKEDDKDEFINTLKNSGYNCNNIIKY